MFEYIGCAETDEDQHQYMQHIYRKERERERVSEGENEKERCTFSVLTKYVHLHCFMNSVFYIIKILEPLDNRELPFKLKYSHVIYTLGRLQKSRLTKTDCVILSQIFF